MPLAAFPKCFLPQLCVEQSMSPADWVHLAADHLDVDGLELYWGFVPHGDPAALQSLREVAGARGLALPMMCYSPDFTRANAAERALEVRRQKRAMEVTAELGGKYCRVLSGQRRPELSVADGLAMAGECIMALLEVAADHGIVLVLENHYKDGFWQYPEFAQSTELFLQLLNSIPDSPAFGVNYDPSNAIIAGEDPLQLLREVAPRVVTMHASDRYFAGGGLAELRELDKHPAQGYAPILRHGVIGQGLNDYDAIFSVLCQHGFQGWISIEDGEDAGCGMEHLRLSAQFLRSKMAEYGLK